METKSASAASAAAAAAVSAASQRDQMTAPSDGRFNQQQNQSQKQQQQHRPTVPPKPIAFRDDSSSSSHQQQQSTARASNILSSSPRRLPLVDLTSRLPSNSSSNSSSSSFYSSFNSSDLPSPQPQQPQPQTPQTPLTPVSPFYHHQPTHQLQQQTQQQTQQPQSFDVEQFAADLSATSYRLRNASVGKSEDDSNDSDESEDTFQDFDDLRDFVKPVKNVTTGQLVLVPPESIDAFELTDDDGEEEEGEASGGGGETGGGAKESKRRVVQLTERQKKSLENRLSTFSMRIKSKQAAKTHLRDLFKEPSNMTKQTYVVTKPASTYHDQDDQHNSNNSPPPPTEMVDGLGGHSHNHRHRTRPVSTIFDVAGDQQQPPLSSFKPQHFPQLGGGHEKAGPRNSSNVISSGNNKGGGSSMYSASNLARFQSTPNIASPDLYGHSSAASSNKRIDALKSQGKNIQQKFRNLFVRKQNRKHFNLANSGGGGDLDGNIGGGPKRRTNSTNHDADQDGADQAAEGAQEPQELIIPPRRREEQHANSGANNSDHRSSVYLQQPTPQTQLRSSGRIDTDVDFTGGVEIRSIRYNASYRKPNKKSEIRRYELLEALPIEAGVDLPETLSNYGVIFCIDGEHLKSFSLQYNINYIDQLTRNYTSAAAKVALLELGADLKDVFKRAHDVKMPRFKDERKKANPNLVFGGYLTQLHQLDRKRNPHASVDCPSLLHHLVNYVALHGIHEEGIFRVTGAQSRLKNLKNELAMLYQSYYKYNRPDDREEIYGILEKYSPFDVAGVLKLFLRELTQPLFTNELMEIFLKIPGINRLDMKIKMLNLLMLILNDSHRNSLSAVLQLFHLVVQNEAVNKMSLDAVCTVMAPNLMTEQQTNGHSGHSQRSPAMNRRMSYSSQSVNEVPEEMAAYLRRTTNSLAVCKLLINLHPLLFHIPPYIYRQVKKESY